MKSLSLTLLLTLCASCAPQTRNVMVPPKVPLELRQPCAGPDLRVETAADVSRVLVGYGEALACANGRIVAIDEILRAGKVSGEAS